MKKIIIRADASQDIGTGHVMRCLCLAGLLAERGADIEFVCRDLPGNMAGYITDQGFCVHLAENDTALIKKLKPDLVIVDHYGLDIDWHRTIRPYTGHIMVIDDLANREYDCDILLDQNYYKGLEQRYDGLVSPTTKLFLGPSYALLREEFRQGQAHIPPYRNRYDKGRIMIFFGGMDAANETARAIVGLGPFHHSARWHFDVVIGQGNPHRNELRALVSQLSNMTLHIQTSHMAKLMAGACLFIGAGGSASLERLALALPAVVTSIADNQVTCARDLQALGAQKYLGSHEKLTSRDYETAITSLLGDVNMLDHMVKSMKSLSITGAGMREIIDDIWS